MYHDPTSFAPSKGVHALTDLRFQGVDYRRGDMFEGVENIPEDKLRMMWNAGRIGFGLPSARLAKIVEERKAADARAARDKAKAAEGQKDPRPPNARTSLTTPPAK